MAHTDHTTEKATEREMTDEEMMQFFYSDPSAIPSMNAPVESTPLNASLEIPNYLSSIDERKFVKMIEQHTRPSDRPLNREDLRQAAILKHHLTMVELQRSLWESYLQSSTGLVKPDLTDLKFWPVRIISRLKENLRVTTTIGEIDQIPVDDTACLTLVQQQLSNLNEQQQTFQSRWNEKKKQIYDFARLWEEPIRVYVQEQTESLRQHYQCQIQLVEIEYRAHRLECEFREECTNATQMQRATHLFYLKSQYEEAQQEMLLLQEHIAQNKLPASFDAYPRSAPHSFRSLSDVHLGQQLTDRQQNILHDHRKEMISLFLAITEAKLDESRTFFDEAMDSMWQNQRILPMGERFTPDMINLLDRQLALIKEGIESFYRFKIQQLAFRSPTAPA